MSLFDSLGSQPQQQTMNLMQRLQELKQNPVSVLRQAGLNVPDGMYNPQQIIQHLIQSGQVPQNRYNQVLQQMNRMR